jgi:ribosomal protein S18 acetylase RimI-like enzyme
MEIQESRTDTQIRIRKARYADVDVMKKVMARAYDKEPYTLYVVLQDEQRIERAEKMIEIVLKYYVMKYDHVFVPEQVNAVAMWYPPEPKNCWKSSKLRDFSLMHKAISVTGVRGVLSLMHSDGTIKEHHLKNMKEPHYYLFMLGVDPAHQGKGIGSYLVQHGLHMCRERGVPAYLECATEDNVRFYETHNFKVIDEFLVPHNGPKIWTMIYEPK